MSEMAEFAKAFGFCTAAALFYSLLMKTPRIALFLSALLAGTGYTLYLYVNRYITGGFSAYFLATLFIAVVGEIMARICKMPSTIFVFPAVIPLVPGYGLYRTMLLLVQNDFGGFVQTGAKTFFVAGAIAIAIALTNFTARYIFPRRRGGTRGYEGTMGAKVAPKSPRYK